MAKASSVQGNSLEDVGFEVLGEVLARRSWTGGHGGFAYPDSSQLERQLVT